MKTIYCSECGDRTADIAKGSVVDKNAVMMCRRCYNDVMGINRDVHVSPSPSMGDVDAFNNLMNIFKGFK